MASRWPHVRPDAVVSEETWNMMKEEFPEKVPAEMLTKRDLWDEGLATDDPSKFHNFLFIFGMH